MRVEEVLKKFGMMAERHLEQILDRADIRPEILDRAIRYSLFSGGKRIRPVLAMMCCEAAGGDAENALVPACCVEMVHCYSLIHDDLPCMDDDDFRRGKPSNHIAFGEDVAVLSGDALLTQAFETLSDPEFVERVGCEKAVAMVSELACAAGGHGMVAGQVMDMNPDVDVSGSVKVDFVKRLQSLKTGALIVAACRMGALSASASELQMEYITGYARSFGFLFQITDDLLDAFGDAELVGKALNKDAKMGKVNLVTVFGADEARRIAREAADEAKQYAVKLGDAAKTLVDMVDLVCSRQR